MMKQRHHNQNTGLLPLPGAVPEPDVSYNTNTDSQNFYNNCATGTIEEVRKLVKQFTPTNADCQHGLALACHNFEVPVVRYLMKECHTNIHTGCFQRKTPESSQNIFKNNNQNLFELLKTFIENGWHPNQVLSPLRREDEPPYHLVQEVALHYERCLRDKRILELLLTHGADPTIARWRKPVGQLGIDQLQAPLEWESGDILNMAVRVGTPETIKSLLSYGANLEHGCPLHSLVQRSRETGQMPNNVKEMAEYLLEREVDINGVRNVFPIVRHHSEVVLRHNYEATPFSHASESRDFAFLEWLLQRGANTDDCRMDNRDEYVYGFNGGHAGNAKRVRDLIKKIRSKADVTLRKTAHCT